MIDRFRSMYYVPYIVVLAISDKPSSSLFFLSFFDLNMQMRSELDAAENDQYKLEWHG